jgi:hypothetical protein
MKTLLSLIAISLLALAGCGSSTRLTKVDPALAVLVPSDTVMLAGLKMEPIRKTVVYQKYLGERGLPLLDQFAASTGLDPRTDLWEILLASDGKKAVMMARGKFAEMGREPRLDLPGSARTSYRGYTVIENEENAVVFLNATTAVAGTPAVVKGVLDRRDSPSPIPAELQELVKSIPVTHQVWAVSLGGAEFLNPLLPAQGNLAMARSLVAPVKKFSAAMDLEAGFDGYVLAECGTPEDTKQLYDALRALVGLARLSTPTGQAEMLALLEAVSVTQQQQKVELRARVPLDLLEKIAAKAGEGGARSMLPFFQGR